ncbi:MAG: GNAT family N-acetyltransferase [Anaerolineae bacterium]|jgi:GNAT superfamily N-acetyltransferase|nr:GNAT family N-acetyltransferase [Anaerolineae bacterium]
MELIPFDLKLETHHAAAAALWTAACGPDLAITPAFVAFNTRFTTGVSQAGQLVLEEGQPVGFVLASATTGDPTYKLGWIDALAVSPAAQRKGYGSALLAWAEIWLDLHGAHQIRSGGSLRPFTPGLLTGPGSTPYEFFARRGYVEEGIEWDVANDLITYPDPPLPAGAPILRPVETEADRAALFDFLSREFPGRWAFECQEFFREGGRPSDWMLLWPVDAEKPAGFCQITLEDSLRPIERFYPHRLPHPWGQFGPLGVAASARGKGYGAAVVDGAARHLKQLGVRGCIIDWTSLTDFYSKFGFTPYRKYHTLVKELIAE